MERVPGTSAAPSIFYYRFRAIRGGGTYCIGIHAVSNPTYPWTLVMKACNGAHAQQWAWARCVDGSRNNFLVNREQSRYAAFVGSFTSGEALKLKRIACSADYDPRLNWTCVPGDSYIVTSDLRKPYNEYAWRASAIRNFAPVVLAPYGHDSLEQWYCQA
jgi:hypothetical protein